MTSHKFEEQLRSDLQSQLGALLEQEPNLAPEAAMAKITENILKNNPFVPPEGDKCLINTLPDELLAYLFETGLNMEIDALQFGEEDEDYEESDYSDIDEKEDEEEDDEDGEDEEAGVIVDGTNGDEDDADWSDVDEEEETGRGRRQRKKKNRNGDDDDEDNEEDDEDERLPFQVLASHVCKRWRSIALDTPALWTLLYIEKGTSLDKHKAFIERAKNAPLGITIECTYEGEFDEESELQQTVNQNRDKELLRCLKGSLNLPDPSLPDLLGDPNWHLREVGHNDVPLEPQTLDDQYYGISEFSEILDMIIPRSQYWKGLCVRVSDYRWMYLLLARLHQCGPVETLEALELYHYDDDDTGEWFHAPHLATKFTPFHGQAPHLRYCVLWGVHLDWDASLGILKNLEEIELAYHVDEVRPSYGTLQTVLERPDTKKLTLCLSGPRGIEDDWRNAGAQPIQIPSLKSLTLRYHTPEYACSLLRFLDTPNVTSLSLDFDEDEYNDFVKDLCKASHGRSKSLLSGLESFKMTALPCDRRLAHKILDQLVNLKFLDLNCMGEGEMFFKALLKGGPSSEAGEPSARKIYCPALEVIKTSGISGKQMKEFVELCMKAGVPLKKVLMCEIDDIDASSYRWLKENVKEFEYFDPSDSEEEVFDDNDDDDDDDEQEIGDAPDVM